MTQMQLIQIYDRNQSTHDYIIGVKVESTVYACYCTSAILPLITKLKKASRNNGMALRFIPNDKQRAYIMKNSWRVEVLCSAEYLEDVAHNVGKQVNRGTAFEKIFTESKGQHWEKDSVKFTECGDIELDGKQYQIKYEGASFINEATASRLA